MAISNFTELNAAVLDWMARSEIAGKSEDFLVLGEARINRILRAREMNTAATILAVSEKFAIPSDFVGVISVTDLDNFCPLSQISRKAAREKFGNQGGGITSNYEIFGSDIFAYPTTPASIELLYFASVPPLTSLDPVNWLITKHPDLYMKAAQCEAFEYVQAPDQLSYVEAKFSSLVNQINQQADLEIYGDAGHVSEGYTP